jgi:VWFA-related protein
MRSWRVLGRDSENSNPLRRSIPDRGLRCAVPKCAEVGILLLCFAISALGQSPQNVPPSPPPSITPADTSSVPAQTDPNQTPSNSSTPQDQASPQDIQGDAGQFVFKKKVEEVILHAVVVDQQNNLISNLKQAEFQIYEDGKPQQITSFHQEHVPVALGVLIDNSGSMRPKREAVNQAALNLVRASHPQDEMFVVNFGEEYYLDQDFTNDEVKLKNALAKIETHGSTALYDAVVASAKHMKQNAPLQKRILLVVTDGDDNASQESLEETVQQLQQKDGPVVYVIALLSGRKNVNSMVRSLQTISQKTGGTAYFPTDVAEVDSITRNIAAAVRSQYVIGYKSTSTAAGHVYHAIQVDAYDSNHRKLNVRTRSGYYSDSMGGTQ